MPTFKRKREANGYFYVRWSEKGRSRHASLGTKDEAEAQQLLEDFIRNWYTPDEADPADIAIDIVLRRYQDDKRGEIASPYADRRAVEQLISFYGDKPVSFITAATNKQYEVHSREKDGWSNSTINRTRNVLRAALRHAVKDKSLRYAPFVPTLSTKSGKIRWLTYEEALRLYRAVRHWRWRYLNLFIRIGLGTGARHEAILDLTWDRVDLEKGLIDFRDPDKAETKKRRPHAPINDRLLRLLRAARRVSNGDHVIMHRGGPIKRIGDAFREACRRADLKDVTPHTLKHTYITWLLREGVSIWDVAGLTNTTVTTIEKHYGHHAKDKLRDAANALSYPHARKTPNRAGLRLAAE
jgi:integrase